MDVVDLAMRGFFWCTRKTIQDKTLFLLFFLPESFFCAGGDGGGGYLSEEDERGGLGGGGADPDRDSDSGQDSVSLETVDSNSGGGYLPGEDGRGGAEAAADRDGGGLSLIHI